MDRIAFFATAVSYNKKMFMNLIIGDERVMVTCKICNFQFR
jgi:hypothetical protein